MRIAVTGATGFIGRYVLAELESRAIEPVLLVRAESIANGAVVGRDLVACDLQQSNDDLYESAGRPDSLIHLAWSGLPNYRSLHHYERELPAHYRFLRSLIGKGLQSLVVAGTCFEYGMQSGCLNESMPARPTNPYGFAKDVLRRQLEFLQAAEPFRLAWARLFYLYGEGQSANALFSQLKQAVDQGEASFRMSGGEQLRDYLPVSEVARYLVDLAVNNSDPGLVNVCSGTPVSIRKLVEDWISANDWPIEPALGHYPYPDYEPMAFWGDPRKLHLLIGEAE